MKNETDKRPLIGLMPLVDDERESYWMLPGYMDGITAAGGTPIMLPLTADFSMLEQLTDICDGFLFTGGHDVSPAVYGKEPTERCGAVCRKRDEMEGAVLRYAVKNDRPVLGICRGIQFINAYLGGTLYQDIPTEYETDTEHHQSPPYDVPVHDVELVKGKPLNLLLNIDRLEVNSYHHQCVKEVAPCLKVMARACDGIVEGLYMPDRKFIWGIQWHPEFSFKSDENSLKIFKAFVEACKR